MNVRLFYIHIEHRFQCISIFFFLNVLHDVLHDTIAFQVLHVVYKSFFFSERRV